MSADTQAKYRRRLNGLPAAVGPRRPWIDRLVTNPLTWANVVLTVVYLLCYLWMYRLMSADRAVEGGTVPGLNFSALREAAGLALPTLLVWIVLFLWFDRYRPQRLGLWWMALGWGLAVSPAFSLVVNSWAGEEMMVRGSGDPSSGARPAIFAAPFVEEASKASVLFLIAIAWRYRLVSKVGGIALAGLSAAGFAFTENIIYYARVIVYSSTEIAAGDPEAALQSIVFLRGFLTMFGHPLFTMMTGIGLLVGLRAHSKVVRVLAPLIGFLAAALLHMAFNATASLFPQEQLTWIYFTVALPLVLGAVIYAVRQIFAEGRRHRDRLADYVRMGWLRESDVYVFARQRSRWKAVFVALTYGWNSLLATIGLQRRISELVYLRDSQVRGTIDATGDERARELIDEIRNLRPQAVDDPRVQKANLPRLRRKKVPPTPPHGFGPPAYPEQVPAAAGSAPLGSQQYSPVDPRWGPPKG